MICIVVHGDRHCVFPVENEAEREDLTVRKLPLIGLDKGIVWFCY